MDNAPQSGTIGFPSVDGQVAAGGGEINSCGNSTLSQLREEFQLSIAMGKSAKVE